MALHHERRKKLTNVYFEDYKANPEETRKKILDENDNVDEEQVNELLAHFDQLLANEKADTQEDLSTSKKVDTNMDKPSYDKSQNLTNKPDPAHDISPKEPEPSHGVAMKQPETAYKSFDILYGKYEYVDGVKTFVQVGKARKTGVQLTQAEADYFNETRSGAEAGMFTEQIVPSKQ